MKYPVGNFILKWVINMDKTFLGKTLIVTGGASGIGLLTAQCFAQEGGNSVLVDVDEVQLAKEI